MNEAHSVPGMPVDKVTVREVGPRDGFQNEPERIATEDKIRLIDALAGTGLTRLEVASFVRADVIPQLADAVGVLHGIHVPEHVDLTVLVPNERGLEAALEHADRFDEVLVFLSASETHNHKNVNRPVAESLAAVERMLPRIEQAGKRPIASIATSFGCPYEGHVPQDTVFDLAERMAAAGARGSSFRDTTRGAQPRPGPAVYPRAP